MGDVLLVVVPLAMTIWAVIDAIQTQDTSVRHLPKVIWILLILLSAPSGIGAIAWLVTGRQMAGWSALYGAAAVVVPGALMARGMTSRLSSMSPGAGAVSFMLWEFVKIAVSVAMLMLAPKIVQTLSWLALLVGMVVCMKVYWLALLWRGR